MLNKRKSRSIAALSVSGAALLSAATASHAEEGELPVAASANASRSELGDSTVDVNRAQRAENGGITGVTWTVNVESGTFDLNGMSNELYLYGNHDLSGVTLLDEAAQVRYHPLVDSNEVCVCAGTFHPGDFVDRVEADRATTYWDTYLLPESVTTVTLEVPGFEPVTGIPVE